MFRARAARSTIPVIPMLLIGAMMASAPITAAAASPQATVTLFNVAVLPGQVFLGSIVARNPANPVTSATVSGPCVASGPVTDTDPGTPGIQFTLPTLSGSAAGICSLSFVISFADNSIETDAADITMAPSTASVRTVVTQTVSGLGTGVVDVQLFDCSSVTNTNGVLTFRGTQNGSSNFAVPGTNTAVITAVNGTPTNTTSNQANGVTPTNGTVTFSFTDNAAGQCVTPVVFQRGTGAADQLPLGPDNRATVPVAIGAPTTFLPPPAPPGQIATGLIPTAVIIAVAPPYYVITSAGTFIQQVGDVIMLYNSATGTCQLAPRTPGTGHRRLTPGDLFGGSYNPTGTSTFCLADIAPAAPTTVTATQNTTAGGAVATFTMPAGTEVTQAITGFNVYRAPAAPSTTTGGPYTCPTSTPVALGTSPQTPPPPAYSLLTTVPATGAGTYSYNDTTASPGPTSSAPNAFCYAVASVAVNEDGGTQVGSARPANAANPAPLSSGTATAIGPAPEVPALPASATVVVSPTNPSGLGEAVTFTATVTSPGGIPAGGTVQFRDGTTYLGGPVPLSGNTASFTTSNLGVGIHSITAIYSGSATLASSTSTPLTQVVNATITCQRTISGDAGFQTLSPGEWCITGARLTGLTIQPGAAVSITNSKIIGPLTSTGATLFRMCGSQVSRGLSVAGSAGSVLIGDITRGCARNDVSGPTSVSGNTAGIDVSDDRFAGSLEVNSNTGSGPTPADPASLVAANLITTTLSCANNVPPPTNGGRPNAALGGKTGQCASL